MNAPAPHLPNSIWRRTLVAMSLAMVINIVLYYLGQLIVPNGLQVMRGPDTPLEPLPFAAVVFTTAIMLMIGAVVYWLLETFVNEAPNTIFTVVAVVALIVSLAGPLFLASGVATQFILSLMHVVAAGSLIWVLTR